LVQGDGAARTLIEGIDFFDKSGLVDTVIIGRGGGSIEDLWEFNNEELARRIFACSVPVISAVGHETDFTICDFVADMRAPTPSAAAEIAVPDLNVLRQRLDGMAERACGGLEGGLTERMRRLDDARLAYDAKNVEKLLRWKEERLKGLAGKLNSLSPLGVLSRGYAVVSKDGRALIDSSSVEVGDSVEIRLQKGKLTAKVEGK
jgi:exodeoxyribonuclease VII large subunit